MDETETAVVVHFGDNPHMADDFGVLPAAVEHQVANPQGVALNFFAHLVLAACRGCQRYAEFAIDIARESRTVEALGSLAGPAVGGA